MHDPSIIRDGSTYYVFSTDAPNQSGHIPIRCSTDKLSWTACGYVFSSLPSWIPTAVPDATGIRAPDISYFNGAYQLYYAVSSFGSQVSAIGLATNVTLDQTSPNYKWVVQGLILQSTTGDDFNAIDPNIFVDSSGSVWLQYGSFWSGIFQQQIDPSTGKIMAGSPIHHLAERASSVPNDPRRSILSGSSRQPPLPLCFLGLLLRVPPKAGAGIPGRPERHTVQYAREVDRKASASFADWHMLWQMPLIGHHGD